MRSQESGVHSLFDIRRPELVSFGVNEALRGNVMSHRERMTLHYLLNKPRQRSGPPPPAVMPDNWDWLPVEQRRAAAAHWAERGAASSLLRALDDPDAGVVAHAVRGLGAHGDRNAVMPLIATLRRRFVGSRREAQLFITVGLMPLIVLYEAIIIPFCLIATVVVLAAMVVNLLIPQPKRRAPFLYENYRTVDYDLWFEGQRVALRNLWSLPFFPLNSIDRRRQRNELCGLIAEAIARISDRVPAGELRNALPDLRTIAEDRLQQSAQTRQVARRVAERIEAATRDTANLPRPSTSARVAEDRLPRAFGSEPTWSTDDRRLPRATSEEAP